MSAEGADNDSFCQSYAQVYHCIKEARALVQLLPDVEVFAAERALRRLAAARSLLMGLKHSQYNEGDVSSVTGAIDSLAEQLKEFLYLNEHRPQPKATVEPPTGNRGRPRAILDLHRAIELHNLGSSWERVAYAMGVGRTTLYEHLARAGLSSARPPFSDIADNDLDELVAAISLKNPQTGANGIYGHLKAAKVSVPMERVKESLGRVDPIGVMFRWRTAIRRRVYKVRGSNALWHMDGNEKLRPWGFYIHGCVDGHSRRIIYLQCCTNKRAATVEKIFLGGVAEFGWPSRMRGDYGTENNGVEKCMVGKWGQDHKAYLRGRSVHNVRIERLWRDVRQGCLEFWRVIFLHLEKNGLLDIDDPVHRACAGLVFLPRIQESLSKMKLSWNNHKLRTEGNLSPTALYELSKQQAITEGYWNNDPGDCTADIHPEYGCDGGEIAPGDHENECLGKQPDSSTSSDGAVAEVKAILDGFDYEEEDENNGIDIYCQAVLRVIAHTRRTS